MTTKSELLARIDAHEAEGESITAAMAELGVTAKDMKALRKAQAQAKAAKEALDLLMGVAPESACADVADEPKGSEEAAPDPAAEPIVAATEDAAQETGVNDPKGKKKD